jgi:hypothetical protein
VIRQAISCDICGTEKRQTNHWFVAYEQSGELRLSSWASRRRSRPEAKHLCGQTCMHKLVDDFMARAIAVRPQIGEVGVNGVPTDASLTSSAAYARVAAPVRLLAPSAPIVPQPAYRAQPQPARLEAVELAAPLDEPPRFSSRSRRADAWERERQRESRGMERSQEYVGHRGS